ncbi:hypothetical protein BDB01DRAFT_797340 [Pilobolus umbonatus]|nr:hypothetical protein BDB01DRAFT_797340 [Pilobolus umbonatus]
MKLTQLLALFAFTTVAIAAPILDVSMTSVDVTESPINSYGDNNLFVTVTRVDDLLDDDGSLLAERIMAVRVTFAVVDNMLMCNGRPVEIGVSNFQIEAQMAANPDKLSIASEEDLNILADTFDVGLVTVEITASILGETYSADDGLLFRRISVTELITEVNGYKVIQTEVSQQILDVFSNGILEMNPMNILIPADDVVFDQSLNTNEISVFMSALKWWSEQTILIQTLMVCGIYVFFLGVALIIQHVTMASQTEYVLVTNKSDESDGPPAYIENEDKKAIEV